jgi:leucyl aminopeptidase
MDRLEIVSSPPSSLPAAVRADLAKPGAWVVLYSAPQRHLLYHLPPSPATIRETLTAVVRSLSSDTEVVVPAELATPVVRVIIQTLYLANAPDSTLKTTRTPRPQLRPLLATPEQVAVAQHVQSLTRGSLIARFLGNERYDPAQFSEAVHGIFRDLDVTVREIAATPEMGLLTAVGQGAAVPPRLVVLEYRGSASAPVALVGKGITFDTGGIHLKPSGYIEDMYLDKAGAAAVVGAIWTLHQLQSPVHVVGVLALAENAIGPHAVKPSALLHSLHGRTVEVGNTDAEGRLAMADAMTWVQREFKPHLLVDIATLTGSCVSALGEETAGLFFNKGGKRFARQVRRAGHQCGEEVWHLPITQEHRKCVEGKQADLTNSGDGKGGGASEAAAFLEHFAEGTPWVHLDIAGPGAPSRARHYLPSGGTGFGAQLLAEALHP